MQRFPPPGADNTANEDAYATNLAVLQGRMQRMPFNAKSGIDIVPSATSANRAYCPPPSTAASSDAAGSKYVTQLGEHDVVCGRGSGANDNPGNITFRGVILSRKMDYVATPSRRDKSRIALEIVDYIRNEMRPPGKFLMKVEAEAAKEMGYTCGQDVFVEVDDTMALEKVKQALRRGAALKDLGKGERPKDGKGTGTTRNTPSPAATRSGSASPVALKKPPIAVSAAELANQDVTLADWIRCEQKAAKQERVVAGVRLARQIANAVSERHEANVAIGGGLSLNGLLLSQEAIKGRECTVRFVDPCGGAPGPASMLADLVSLGRVLYELFAGAPPSFGGADTSSSIYPRIKDMTVGDDPPTKKREFGQGRAGYVPLHDLALPVSLSILVSSLLDAEDKSAVDRYRAIGEVVKDLNLMESNPEQYLFDKSSVTQLDAPTEKLYGRDREIAKLMEVYDRVIGSGGKCEVALLAGYSGTGKTSLANQVRDRIVEDGGYFVSGKFDSLCQAQPLSAIVAAFNDYCSELFVRDESKTAEIRAAIKEAIGSGGMVLTNLIPNLRYIIGDSGSTIDEISDGKGSLNRLIFFFRKFVQAASSPSHPIVLFIDDLQWADQASLQLIHMLVTDQDVDSLLFLGCYRDNEVKSDHALMTETKKIIAAGIPVETIKVEDLDLESVNAFISDRLQLSPRLTTSLAKIVHIKTSGNSFFVIQFLGSLFDEGLIRYSASSRRWQWDVGAIKLKNIADNCVDLMTRKMSDLPSDVQYLLMVASFLGCKCDEAILNLLCQGKQGAHAHIGPLLDVAEGHGLIYKTGSSYKFSHDQIQRAAYSLAPMTDRAPLHLQIGRLLLKEASETDMESMIFVIVDQLILGKELVTDHDEKVQFTRACLKAGEKAMSSSAFLSASSYLNSGIGLLEEGHWESHYEICVELYSALAEAEYVCGNLERTSVAVDVVLSQARSFDDKLRVYFTLVISLGAQGKLDETIKTGIQVLSCLKVCFPEVVDEAVVGGAIMETVQLLAAKSDSEILELKKLEDPKIEVAMKVLTQMTTYAYFGRQELFPLITLNMVKLTLFHGVCSESALAFSSYALVLVGVLGDLKGGYRYGKLAITLLERFSSKHVTARLYGAILGGINHWCEPLQASLPTSLIAHEIGLSVGDVYFAMMNLNNYLSLSFQCGQALQPLAEEMKRASRKMLDYNQGLIHMLVKPVSQATLNLMGKSADPITLTGEVMDQETFLWEALDSQNFCAACLAYTMCLWLAYMFRNYEIASEMAEKSQDVEKVCSCQFLVCNQKFYEGLTALALARTSSNAKWLLIAGEAIKKMTIWAESVPWNCRHKLELMNAELSFTTGNTDEAVRLYDDAISNAKKHGFVNEEALACERAALFYSDKGDHLQAANYYVKSHQAYMQWGAKRKADDLLALSKHELAGLS